MRNRHEGHWSMPWWLWCLGFFTWAASPHTACLAQGALPKYYGLHFEVDGKIVPDSVQWKELDVLIFPKLTVTNLNALPLNGMTLSVLLFDPEVASLMRGLEIYRLPYARNLIQQPDELNQLFGSLPGGRQPQPQLRSLGKLVLGRAEEFKVSVRATPVSGQPQMVRMVLPESLQPGVYGVFLSATKAGQQGVSAFAFEWNISTYGENAPCIDLVMTGGYGGLIERHDAGILGPLVLPKKRYTSCSPAGGKATSTRPDRLDQSASRAMGASPSSGAEAALIADCSDYDACLTKAKSAFSSGQPVLGATALKKATELQPSKPEAWERLGMAYVRVGEFEKAEAAFDKALELGGRLSCQMFVEGWRPRFATISVGKDEVSLRDNKGATLFAASTASVAIKAAGSGVPFLAEKPRGYLRLRVASKEWTLNFVPQDEACEAVGGYLACPQTGFVQQTWMANYLAKVIRRLGSGSAQR
ncbi:MAG: hypothetical protein KatS3mg004_0188 [Bryobacteraceae bacterium]|nr:MAG: hypothetical protein KatS3mg004_0188 [Bryobacteraceae bacterium]